jgi:hypothetical protein
MATDVNSDVIFIGAMLISGLVAVGALLYAVIRDAQDDPLDGDDDYRPML